MDIKLMALGGLEENGKNSYIIESEDEILVLDVGSKKFENSSLGIDSVVNSPEYLIKNKDKIKGILISHSHLDQMGGLEYLLTELGDNNIGVYGSDYTVEFLKRTIKYQNLNKIAYDSILKLGKFQIEAFYLSHAVFGNFGYAIAKNNDAIVYVTDYNFNQAKNQNTRTDIEKIIRLKNKYNIKVLMTEAIAADKPGSAASHTDLFSSFRRYAEMTKGKLIISLYSTNVSGMLNVIKLAEELNKKIVILGRDLLTYVNISKTLGFIEHKSDMFIKTSDIGKYKDNDIIVVVAGLFLEPFETLKKMSSKNYPITTINENDSVLIASEPYDEIEGTVQQIIDFVSRTNCKIKNQKINVPSHAQQEDIKMMINLFDPEYIIPIKGEYRKFKEIEKIVQDLDSNISRIRILENGEVLTVTDNGIYVKEKIKTDMHLLNGDFNELVNPILLQDREAITEEGYVLIALVIDKKTQKVIQKPEIYSGGLMSFDADENIISKCEEIVEKEIENCEPQELIMKIKNKLKRFLNSKIGKTPLILTVKLEMK